MSTAHLSYHNIGNALNISQRISPLIWRIKRIARRGNARRMAKTARQHIFVLFSFSLFVMANWMA